MITRSRKEIEEVVQDAFNNKKGETRGTILLGLILEVLIDIRNED